MAELSKATISRLSQYLQLVKKAKYQGRKSIASSEIAKVLNLESILVRKDIAATGIVGTPRVGFDVDELIIHIHKTLGIYKEIRAIMIGRSDLGLSLLNSDILSSMYVKVWQIFDTSIDTNSAEPIYHRNIEVKSWYEMSEYIAKNHINMGIIAFDEEATAQEAVNSLVRANVLSIWNLSNYNLYGPSHATIVKHNLVENLALLTSVSLGNNTLTKV